MQGDIKTSTVNVGMIGTNCYIVYKDNTESLKEAVLIDPGDDAEKIYDKVEELGIKPVAVLLTHGHFDHMMAVDQLREKFECKVYLGKEEEALIKDPEQNVSAMFGRPMGTSADEFIEDGQLLQIAGFQIEVLATPGHTKGGVCYYLKEQEIAFSGDTIFEGSVGRSDFPGGSARELIRSIKDKLCVLPDDTQLFPGHGDSTVVSYEKQYNPFL